MEISNLPGRVSQTREKKNEQNEKHDKKLENTKKNQTQVTNTIIEIKNTLEVIHSR